MDNLIEAGSMAALAIIPVNKITSLKGPLIIVAGAAIVIGMALIARRRILLLGEAKQPLNAIII